MRDFLQVFILSILQGLTEFLPISSSAHLILLPKLTGWTDQGLAFDVAVHVGTLFAALGYFRKEISVILLYLMNSILQKEQLSHSRLAWAVGFGTIPIGLVGLFFKDIISTNLRSQFIIALTTIGFGGLLGIASWLARQQRDEHTINWLDVFLIGIAQTLALIPGTSRSGITITVGLMLGLTRRAAVHYSFLLSIPVIIMAGSLEAVILVNSHIKIQWTMLLTGTVLSGISAYGCIHIFLKLLDQIGFLPFVIYRFLFGFFTLIVLI